VGLHDPLDAATVPVKLVRLLTVEPKGLVDGVGEGEADFDGLADAATVPVTLGDALGVAVDDAKQAMTRMRASNGHQMTTRFSASTATPLGYQIAAAVPRPSTADPEAPPARVLTVPVASTTTRTKWLSWSATKAKVPAASTATLCGLVNAAAVPTPSLLPGAPPKKVVTTPAPPAPQMFVILRMALLFESATSREPEPAGQYAKPTGAEKRAADPVPSAKPPQLKGARRPASVDTLAEATTMARTAHASVTQTTPAPQATP
jgi:hypothetical protein